MKQKSSWMFFHSNHINTLEFVWLINGKAKCCNEILTHGDVLSLISKRAFLRKLNIFYCSVWYENQVTMNPMVFDAIKCMRWENRMDREFHALAKLVVNKAFKRYYTHRVNDVAGDNTVYLPCTLTKGGILLCVFSPLLILPIRKQSNWQWRAQ